MKPSLIFAQYVWLVNTLRRYGRLTLEELNEKWQDDDVADGNPLSRSTFNRHREAVLYMFGVNTVALLASAGIVSIAVGMGAKDMVSDILAGLFLAVEDSVHIGDDVTVGSWKGRVTNMGIRTTEITDENSNVKIMNNSRISDVVNMSRQKTSCVLELVLQVSTGREETEKLLAAAVETASDEMPQLYGSLQLEEIEDISKKSCKIRLSYICSEAAREAVTEELREYMKKQVEQDDIKQGGI